MEIRQKDMEKTPSVKDYINEINWDFLLFRSLTVIGSIIMMGLLGYFLWFVE